MPSGSAVPPKEAQSGICFNHNFFRVSLRQTPRYGVDNLASVLSFRVYWNSRFFIDLNTLRTEHFEA